MKSLVFRGISFILALVFFITATPQQVYAIAGEGLRSLTMEDSGPEQDGADNSAGEDETRDEPAGTQTDLDVDLLQTESYITDEIVELREENVKHFRMSDHSIVMAVYPEPVHYESDGVLLDIDNALVPVEAESEDEFDGYETKANRFDLRFAKAANQNNMVSLGEDKYRVSWSALYDETAYLDELTGIGEEETRAVPAEIVQEIVETDPAEEYALEVVESEITYENIQRGVDFQYIPTNNGVKENIILNRRGNSYEYAFALNLVGLLARLNSDNEIELYDENAPDEVKYSFPAPFMYDAKEEKSTDVWYGLTQITDLDTVKELTGEESAAETPAPPEGTAPGEVEAPAGEPSESGPAAAEAVGYEASGAPQMQALAAEGAEGDASQPEAPDEPPSDPPPETPEPESGAPEEPAPEEPVPEEPLPEDSEPVDPAPETPAADAEPEASQEDIERQEELDKALAKENLYIFTITADEAWINDSARAWPVVIDPVLKCARKYSSEYVYHDLEGWSKRQLTPASSFVMNATSWMAVGKHSTNGIMRSFFRFSVPYLQPTNVVSKVEFSLSVEANRTSKPIKIYALPGNPTSTNIPDMNLGWPAITLSDSDMVDYATTANSTSNTTVKLDITDTARKMYDNPAYKPVFCIAARDENATSYTHICPHYADPYLIITYRNFSGIESYLSAHSQSVGRAGTGYVNDYSGNLVFVHDDVSTAGNRMPASLQHVYNTNDNTDLAILDPWTKTGQNWRLSYQQTLSIPVGEANVETYPYVYMDGDGTKHYFKGATVTIYQNGASREVTKSAGGAKDTDGLGLFVVPVSDATLKETYPFKMQDKAGNTVMYFTKAGRLGMISDANQKENAGNSALKARNRILVSHAAVPGVNADAGLWNTVLAAANAVKADITNAAKVQMLLTAIQAVEKSDPFVRISKDIYQSYFKIKQHIMYLRDNPTASSSTRTTKINEIIKWIDTNTTNATDKKNAIQTKVNDLKPFLATRMVSIKDGADKLINLGYDSTGATGKITTISDPTVPTGGVLAFTYTGNNITKISYPQAGLGASTFTYDTAAGLSYRLKAAQDYTGYRIEYGHSNTNAAAGWLRNRVTKVTEYSGATKGNEYSIEYKDWQTTTYRFSGKDDVFNTADDTKTTYIFDETGKTISLYSTRAGDGLLYGGAAYAYTADDEQSSNKISESAQGAAHSVNLLKNHSFERGSNGLEHWTKYGDATMTSHSSTSTAMIGGRAARYYKSGTLEVALPTGTYPEPLDGLKQEVTLPAGVYTFSGNIKTKTLNGYARLKVAVPGEEVPMVTYQGGAIVYNPRPVAPGEGFYDRGNPTAMGGATTQSVGTVRPIGDSGDVTSENIDDTTTNSMSGGWVRSQITFEITQTTTLSMCVEVKNPGGGTAYFDCLQLERGDVPNPYNILEDSSFEQQGTGATAPGYWTFTQTSGAALTPGGAVSGNAARSGAQSYKIDGEYNKTKTLKLGIGFGASTKKFSYMLSGWIKAVGTGPLKKGRKLDVKVERPAYDANAAWSRTQSLALPAADEWVYFSFPLPRANYRSANLQFIMKNLEGTVYIDDLQLTRQDVATQTYTASGKVLKLSAQALEKSAKEYDSLDRRKNETSAAKNITTYTYDSVNPTNNVTKTTKSVGPEEGYTYDLYGNEITHRTGVTTSAHMFNTTTYTADGRFTQTETDTRGNETQYSYNATTGLLTTTTDPKGTTTSYTYDALGRQTSVSTGGLTNTYSYGAAKGNLDRITHNSFYYDFTYNAFDSQTAVKAAGQTLVAYEYGPNNGKLTKTTYGNGHTVQPIYNDREQVVGEIRNGDAANPVSEVRYGNDGREAIVFDYLNGTQYS